MDRISLSTISDSLKYETMGMAIGVLGGGATEFVANELCSALGLDRGGASEVAEVFVRGAVSAIGYVLLEPVMRAVNLNRNDPTGGAFFLFAFTAAQDRFYHVTVRLGQKIASGSFLETESSKGACCSDCAEGKSCSGGR